MQKKILSLKIIPVMTMVVIILLAPYLEVNAVTAGDLSAGVHIVCPDKEGNWFSGSGTLISKNGAILTNRHVVTSSDGKAIKFCKVGVYTGIGSNADFSDDYIAETRYYSESNEIDAALLFILNGKNNFNYSDISSLRSDILKKGDHIEVLGYPAYNDLKLTKTVGKFVGFGSEDLKNYFEATTYINHGNSGGSALSVNGFSGIPTFSIKSLLGEKYYFLSISSIKKWLKSTLGSNYLSSILGYKFEGEVPLINLPEDHTGPVIKNAPRDVFWYKSFDGNGVQRGMYVGNNKPFKDLYVSDNSPILQITMRRDQFHWSMDDLDKDGTGVKSVFYSFANNIQGALNGSSSEYTINYENISDDVEVANLTPVINLPKVPGIYYINIRFKDGAGNISEPYILTYAYEGDDYLGLKNLKFYSDPGLKKLIGNYDVAMQSWDGYIYPEYHQYCVTSLKELYVKWEYKKKYSKYVIGTYNVDVGEMSSAESVIKKKTELIGKNFVKVARLNLAKENNEYYGYNICENKKDTYCHTTGKISSFVLKPYLGTPLSLEGKNTVVKFAYNPKYPKKIRCGTYDPNLPPTNFGHLPIILSDGKR